MKLHTRLTRSRVYTALAMMENTGKITPDVHFVVYGSGNSRSHPYRHEIQLGTYDKYSLRSGYRDQRGNLLKVRRYKNSGNGGADSIWSATWHEWGWFMAEIFRMDPGAMFGDKRWGYNGVDDFNEKTGRQFILPGASDGPDPVVTAIEEEWPPERVAAWLNTAEGIAWSRHRQGE